MFHLVLIHLITCYAVSFLNYCFIYLLLAVLCLCCCVGFSVVVMSRGSSLVVVHRFLIAVVSFSAEHGLQDMQASGVMAPRF